MPASNGVAEAGNVPASMGGDAKIPELKEKLPTKRSKGNLGGLNMITGKSNGFSKTPRMSTNEIYPKSLPFALACLLPLHTGYNCGWANLDLQWGGESAIEDTSEGSDANSQDLEFKSGGRRDSLKADASQNGVYAPQNGGINIHDRGVNQPMPISVAGAPGAVPGLTTNLNIGMDYWGAPTSTIPVVHGKVASTAVAKGMVTTGSQDGVQPQLLLQDERALKRQRRKQSNRESARRSRLRKQAECEELAERADGLKEEYASLRSEVSRIRSECEKLLSENAALKGMLKS